ncbi:MAG: 2-dehydropantoate 2-reductase [Tistlia sp.]|uniref:2-dehydropantoate 2-reductase n=1 Tax=Tistlia sp. TaxID=3057121 RepID=UPI0034A48BF8
MSVTAARSSVAVVGLGSIGGCLAGCLLEAGRHDLVACTRRPIERLVFERNGTATAFALDSLTDPEAAGTVDWVLLCTKTHETAAAGPWLRRLCGPETRVAVLQNGLGQRERVAPFVGAAAVLPVLVYVNGERLEPHRDREARVRLSQVAAQDLAAADTAEGRALAALFEGTALRVALSADLTTLLWRKLLLNAAANPISALARRRQAVFRRPDVQDLALAVLREAVAVGRAEGAALGEDEAERTLATLLGYPPETGTSMYFDALAGRGLEVEALTGALVAAGARHGVATPLNDALLTLLRALGEGEAGGAA